MKTVISYAYFETLRSAFNLDFFAKAGIFDHPDYLFIIVINGQKCSVELPTYTNCIIINRENEGFDFGAHTESLNYLANLHNCPIEEIPYDNFVFLNCSVMGPFMPTYVKGLLWPDIFTSRLTDKIKLVGTSIVCFSLEHRYGAGPYVEGFCFSLDKVGLCSVLKNKPVFTSHKSKDEAIYIGEYGLTEAILQDGHSIDCLLYKYNGSDWLDTKHRLYASKSNYPTRDKWYDGISINPFEVVFHKWYWQGFPLVGFNETMRYRDWKIKQLNNSLRIEYGTNDYKIDVTQRFLEKYRKSNNLIIDYGTNFNQEYNQIYDLLVNFTPDTNIEDNIYVFITISGRLYKLKPIVDFIMEHEKKIYYIETPPELKLRVSYGTDGHQVDFTNVFLNELNTNGKVVNVTKDTNFNEVFGDVYPSMIKKMFVFIAGATYILSERRQTDFTFDLY